MAPSSRAHARSHSLLLLQRLLNLRDSASPLTLILDSLEQSGTPAAREFVARAKIARARIVFVSFVSVSKPRDADVFVRARRKDLKALRAEIASHCQPQHPAATGPLAAAQRVLIVVDSLNPLCASHPGLVSAFLSSIIISPAVSVVAVYHTDVPLVFHDNSGHNEYEPHPLTVLCHLATAVLRVSSLYQEVERRRARNRSQQEPEWGLHEGREGVLVGLSKPGHDGVVLEMEMRRRSGRAVVERFVLDQGGKQEVTAAATISNISLLSDHPLFAPPSDPGVGSSDGGGGGGGGGQDGSGGDQLETTFSLGLTEKQRRDREGIVLPYFDAQTDIGAGEGGRILYEMGREDDFDDEEDEI